MKTENYSKKARKRTVLFLLLSLFLLLFFTLIGCSKEAESALEKSSSPVQTSVFTETVFSFSSAVTKATLSSATLTEPITASSAASSETIDIPAFSGTQTLARSTAETKTRETKATEITETAETAFSIETETEPVLPPEEVKKDWLEETSVTQTIPFETEKRYSDEYYIGEEKVLREGKEGLCTVTTLTAFYEGAVLATWEDKVVETEPISRIVVLGTKSPESREVVKKETVLPFSEKTIYDPDAYEDVRTVECEGKNGLLTETIRITYYKETETERVLLACEQTDPTDRVIRIGTKPIITYETVTKETVLPFSEKTIYDSDAYEDVRTVECEGKNGLLTETIRITYYKETETERVLLACEQTDPTDRVIRIGTKPIITYETVTEETVLPFSSRSVEDASLALGTTELRTAGKDGKQINTYRITYSRGTEKGRELIGTEREEPTEEVTAVGTYVAPAETFRLPYLTAGESKEGYVGHAYSITQYYGHNGHGGLDIGVWYGNAVVASMSGTVVMAYNEGDFDPATDKSMLWTYGTFVVIEHDNGTRTYYAHLRIRWVSVGEKVTQGQIIGQSGNTGRVNPSPTSSNPYAGTHLHFEVRVYDAATGKWVRKNPLDYLP